MRKLFIIVTTISLFTNISYRATATNVGGIISSNTTWTLAGSPYNLISNVQVANGVTLSIESGVEVFGNHYWIEIWGIFNATGTETSKIILENMYICAKDSTGIININFCEIDSIQIRTYGDILILRDSILRSYYNVSQGIHVCNGSSYSYIERNIFLNTVDIDVAATNTYIHNNVFYEQLYGEAIISGNANPSVKYNSFLSTDRIAVKLQDSGTMTATENYWNTTDINVINSMIWDRNDSLSINNYIPYIPFLMESHPNTPIFLPDQILTIQADPSDANTLIPTVGQHSVSGLVDISADTYINCPDVYLFDHWEGDVANPNSASTTVFMDSDKTITAIFTATRECGDECHPNDLFGDYNHDCIINIIDFSEFALNWLVCTKPECD